MAAFVDRVGRATAEQVRERFGLSERVAWRRVQAPARDRPPPKLAALRRAGDPLPPRGGRAEAARSRPFTRRHVGRSRVRAAGRRGGHRTHDDPRVAPGGRAVDLERDGVSQSDPFKKLKHLPDLAVRTDEGLVAIEVELTRKGKQRLGRLMSAWARQSVYREVLYLCGSTELQHLIEGQARLMGADEVVRPMLLDRAKKPGDRVKGAPGWDGPFVPAPSRRGTPRIGGPEERAPRRGKRSHIH